LDTKNCSRLAFLVVNSFRITLPKEYACVVIDAEKLKLQIKSVEGAFCSWKCCDVFASQWTSSWWWWKNTSWIVLPTNVLSMVST